MPDHQHISAPPVVQPAAHEAASSLEAVLEQAPENNLGGLFIQRKLSVGAPDDPLEHEADAIADRVMHMPEDKFIRRNCEHGDDGNENIHRKPLVSFIQKKCAVCADEEKEPVQRKSIPSFIQRKCAACEEEETINRKPVTSFIQRKENEDGTVSSTISDNIQSTKGSGSPMDGGTLSFMEQSFGTDFSNVGIHTGGYATGLAGALNAQAFTVGNDIYFNEGKYAPATGEGKHLLAHELTHTVQQGGQTIRRAPGDDEEPIILDVSGGIDFDFHVLEQAYNSLGDIGDFDMVLVIHGAKGDLYKVNVGTTKTTRKLVGSYSLRAVAYPSYFLILTQKEKFIMLGRYFTELADGFSQANYTEIGLKNDTPREKEFYQLMDQELNVASWFINENEKLDFTGRVPGNGFAIVINPETGAAAGSGTGGEDAPPPPMPKWMKPYKVEMQQLISETKIKEPYSTDIPDTFLVYYSKTMSKWSGAAKQATKDPKKPITVYFGITEKDDKNEKLQQIRDKVRIRQLEDPTVFDKDLKPLDPKLTWAKRLQAELDALIKAERKVRPDSAELPDKTGLVTGDDGLPFLRVWKYIVSGDSDGNLSTELKSMTMAAPLIKGMKAEQLLVYVKQAVLHMEGGDIKAVNEDQKDYETILDAFPAFIQSPNIRNDFRSVTGAELQFHMNLTMEALEGMDTLRQAATYFRGILYTWDVYRVSEVVPAAELAEMPADWETKRKQLQAWFKSGSQLESANPAIKNEQATAMRALEITAMAMLEKQTLDPRDIGADDVDRILNPHRILAPNEITTYRNADLSYGLSTSYDATGTIDMPLTEGEYVVYCHAVVDPSDTVLRLPSEAFFTVKLTDGYKMADEIRDQSLTEMSNLTEELTTEKDEGKKKKKQERLDVLMAKEGRTLWESANFNQAAQEDLITLVTQLMDYYDRAKSKEVPDFLVADVENGIITKEDFDKLMDVWMYVETADSFKKPKEQLQELIDNARGNIKGFVSLKQRMDLFSDDLEGYEILPAPVVGLISRVTGQAYPLLVTIGVRDGFLGTTGTMVMLVDITTEQTQESYLGISMKARDEGGLEEAVQYAFDNFGEECKYGKGFISYRVPGTDASGHSESSPGPIQRVKEILGIVAAVAGIAALIVGTVFTGGALAVVAGYVAVGAGIVGAGLAADNIYDRAVNHRLHADVELAMDLLNIAGPVIQGLSALNKLAKVTTLKSLVDAAEAAGELSQAERGVITLSAIADLKDIVMLEKTLMIIQKGEAITNVGLIAYKTYTDLAMVAEVYGDDPVRMRAMQSEIIKNAIISGTFALIALKNEFKFRGPEELDGLVNSLIKDNDYEAAMIKSGIKDVDGNWKDQRLQEYFTGKGKQLADQFGPPKQEELPGSTKDGTVNQEHVVDTYEEGRQVKMKGHAESPDGLHEVEVYPDKTVGRCSSVTGEKCPVLQLVFKEVLDERPVLKTQLETLSTEIGLFGENVPESKMLELASLEERMRNLQMVRATSSAPAGMKIMEVGYGAKPDLPSYRSRTLLEFPNGERVWRDADGNTQHEASLKPSIGRQGYENDFYSGTQTGLTVMRGTQRAHAFGQGFGWESPYALWYAPEYVNQRLQNNGIEQYARSLRDALPPGQQLVIHTVSEGIPATRRLSFIHYEGFILTATGEKIPAFSYEIGVAWKSSGGSKVDAAPIQFKTNSDPAKQQVLTDMQGLVTPPDFITNSGDMDIP